MIEETDLLLDVVERVGRIDREADQDNVRIGVGKRTQAVIILLAGRIPKGELYMLTVNLDVGNVVFENSWDVNLKGGVSLLIDKKHISMTTRVGC